MTEILEIAAILISAAAFGYGIFRLFRPGIPKYFQLYACAAGCYMLEELWVAVNFLLGNGAEDGLGTIRLLGIFGCMCFMVSANANEFDKVVDEGRDRQARVKACIAPAGLLVLYGCFVFSPENKEPLSTVLAGAICLLPGLVSAWFCMKHLLLEKDAMGFLEMTKEIDRAALCFLGLNAAYPVLFLYFPGTVIHILDVLLAGLLFFLVILCVKGAEKWKTLI